MSDLPVDIDLRSGGDLGSGSASGVPFWGDSPGAWETVIIAGKSLPGIATVKGKAFSHRVDNKKSSGVAGSRSTVTGSDPASFEVVLVLWTAGHLRDFAAVVDQIKPRFAAAPPAKTATPNGNGGWTKSSLEVEMQQSITRPRTAVQQIKPLDIRHPALDLYRIRSAFVLSATFPQRSGAGYSVTLDCLEYRPPKSVGVNTPSGSGSLITQNIHGTPGLTAPSSTNAGPR